MAPYANKWLLLTGLDMDGEGKDLFISHFHLRHRKYIHFKTSSLLNMFPMFLSCVICFAKGCCNYASFAKETIFHATAEE